MSYLQTPRLIFSGDFYTDPSTVNNDQNHYNNGTFTPEDQTLQTSTDANGWWNPEGSGRFDFRDCTIQEYELPDGTIVNTSAQNPLIGSAIAAAEGRATGKIVDLDPNMQGASQIWGMRFRVLSPDGQTALLDGKIEVSPFRNMGTRSDAGGTLGAGATWTSIVSNIKWNYDPTLYPLLQALETVASDNENKLSLNFNVFEYQSDYNSARFNLGKVVGALGPWYKGEPITLPQARRLIKSKNTSYFGFTQFLYDQNKETLTLDFGQSMPLSIPKKKKSNEFLFNNLVLGVMTQANLANDENADEIPAADFIEIGQVNYTGNSGDLSSWILKGGYARFNNLSEDVKNLIPNNPVVLLTKQTDGTYILLAYEDHNGYIIEADQFIQRLDTYQTKSIQIYTYQWGQPVDGEIEIVPYGKTYSKGPSSYLTNMPLNGVHMELKDKTLIMTGTKIGYPRPLYSDATQTKITGTVDGQIYFYSLNLKIGGVVVGTDIADIVKPTNPKRNIQLPPFASPGISIHLRSYFEVPENPTWSDIEEMMIQYSNLYPVMSKYVVDLSDEAAIKERKDLLIFAFSQDIEDPLYMPATRDLSEAKRITILKWLRSLPDTNTTKKPVHA